MTRHRLGFAAAVALLGWAGAAVGQQQAPPYSVQQGYQAPGPLNYLPYYQPQAFAQTGRPILSPYLNLLNGNNPALNYYYGVQPLLPQTGGGGFPQQSFNPAGQRGFFQPVQPKPEPQPYPEPDDAKRFTLPPPGSPVVYGNSYGSSRAGITGGGRGGYFSPQASRTTTGATPGARPQQSPTAIPKAR